MSDVTSVHTNSHNVTPVAFGVAVWLFSSVKLANIIMGFLPKTLKLICWCKFVGIHISFRERWSDFPEEPNMRTFFSSPGVQMFIGNKNVVHFLNFYTHKYLHSSMHATTLGDKEDRIYLVQFPQFFYERDKCSDFPFTLLYCKSLLKKGLRKKVNICAQRGANSFLLE